MKRIALSTIIIFFSTLLFSQSDIIYPSKSQKIIRRCSIIEVKEINVVYYLKKNVLDSMEAIAIVRNNLFINLKSNNLIPLFKNHDYNYYLKEYNRALINRKIGIGITGLGFGMAVVSIVILDLENMHSTYDGMIITVFVGLTGIIHTVIGVCLWTQSALKVKNNKKAMQMTNPITSLSFGATNNGIGLVLNF